MPSVCWCKPSLLSVFTAVVGAAHMQPAGSAGGLAVFKQRSQAPKMGGGGGGKIHTSERQPSALQIRRATGVHSKTQAARQLPVNASALFDLGVGAQGALVRQPRKQGSCFCEQLHTPGKLHIQSTAVRTERAAASGPSAALPSSVQALHLHNLQVQCTQTRLVKTPTLTAWKILKTKRCELHQPTAPSIKKKA